MQSPVRTQCNTTALIYTLTIPRHISNSTACVAVIRFVLGTKPFHTHHTHYIIVYVSQTFQTYTIHCTTRVNDSSSAFSLICAKSLAFIFNTNSVCSLNILTHWGCCTISNHHIQNITWYITALITGFLPLYHPIL